MPDALHLLLPVSLDRYVAAAVVSYAVAALTLGLAAGISLGWVWGRR